jgi:antitoxin component YwqK of YwqJK toxin-antitoxin module
MRAMRKSLTFSLMLLAALPAFGKYGSECEVNGQSVSPNNGATTAGKTGVMRCRNGDTNQLEREQELRNGEYIGLVRTYKDGVLQREYSENERRNRDGRYREFAATPGTNNPVLLEETYHNGTHIGLGRRWDASGVLRRASFHDDEGREQASAEFNPQGRLSELRCGPQAVLAPAADDAAWCGHKGKGTVVSLYSARDDKLRGTVVYERGDLRRRELLGDDGKPREQLEATADGGVERSFSDTGVKVRERRWVTGRDARLRRIYVLEQSFSERGTLVQEKRWTPNERGADLQVEQTWYLNGQPKEKSEYLQVDGQPARRDTSYHDNGKLASEGTWLLAGRYDRQASGVHKRFDIDGKPKYEIHYDAKGRMTREREWDAAGTLVHDDEVFEDGSRKANGR